MKKNDLNAILEALNEVEEDADIDETLKGNEVLAKLFEKGMTLDDVKNYLDSTDEGKQYLQSYGDTRVTKGVESFKTNNLQKLVDAELLKRNPSKTPQELKMEELERSLNEEKELRQISEQKSKLKDEFKDKNVDPRMIDLLINKDPDVTRANITLYIDSNKPFIQKEVESRIKDGSYTPPNSDKEKASKIENDINKAFGLI